jgi:hypothetical protein
VADVARVLHAMRVVHLRCVCLEMQQIMPPHACTQTVATTSAVSVLGCFASLVTTTILYISSTSTASHPAPKRA